MVPVVFFIEEPCLNLKQIVSYEDKTAMWSWLRAGLKGMNGAKLFKRHVDTQKYQRASWKNVWISFSLERKRYTFISENGVCQCPCRKSTYESKRYTSCYQTPNIYYLMLPKYYHSPCSKRILCQSLEQLWKLSHHF